MTKLSVSAVYIVKCETSREAVSQVFEGFVKSTADQLALNLTQLSDTLFSSRYESGVSFTPYFEKLFIVTEVSQGYFRVECA